MLMFNIVASRRNGNESGPGDHRLFALLFCLLARSSCAGAEENHAGARVEGPAALRPIVPSSSAHVAPLPSSSFDMARFPDLYAKFRVAPNSMFSTSDFRPRGASLAAAEPAAPAAEPLPLMRETTIWERMADFRSSRGIRLLTLWESAGSTVSLQTGRGGGPSLQWTSRTLGRGEGTHSLLDHLFSMRANDPQPISRGGKTGPSTRPAHSFERPEELPTQRRD